MKRKPSSETSMETSEGGGAGGGAGGVAGIGRGALYPVLGASEEGGGAATPDNAAADDTAADDADDADADDADAVDEAPPTDGVGLGVHAARELL